MEKARIIIIGTDRNADRYVSFAIRNPGLLSISGIASSDRDRRDFLAGKCSIPFHCRFDSWEEILGRPRFADGVVIADPAVTGDASIASLEEGYHLKLEHPDVLEEMHCSSVIEKSAKKGLGVSTTNPFLLISCVRESIARNSGGEFGDTASAMHETHLSPHTLSLLARHNTPQPFLPAPFCHEYDLLCTAMRSRPASISVFEGESAIAPENAPRGAAAFCRECPSSEKCRFNAGRLHVKSPLRLFAFLKKTDAFSEELTDICRSSKCGSLDRCIFSAGANLRDQTARLVFQGDRAAVLTRIAGTGNDRRTLRIRGTIADTEADCSGSLVVRRGGRTEVFAFPDSPSQRRKHADEEIRRFTDSIMGTIPVCSPHEALQGCLLSYAAERSLKNRAPSNL